LLIDRIVAERAILRATVSSQNVERIMRAYDAFNRGELDAGLDGIAPDFELVAPAIVPDPDSYRGADGVNRLRELWQGSFEDFRIEIEEVVDGGDKVLVMAAVCGRGRDSGAEVRSPSFANVWTIRDGQAVRMDSLPNRAAGIEALEATDRSDEPPRSRE
jgi:ketosteroid isomerase-like protein